jgi:assimilatory nitrate reductase catalytic subunit
MSPLPAQKLGAVQIPLETKSTDTHCPYCALQCGMTLVNGEAGLEVAPRDFPTNKGGLCRKGWTSTQLLRNRERLKTPLVRDRKDGQLREASWEEALERVAQGLMQAQNRYGLDAAGIFGGGGLTNEKCYWLGKFARVALNTSSIDYNGRFCMSSAAGAGIKAFGIDRGMPFPLEDIASAEAILLVGSNAAETMPPVMQYFDEQKRSGGKLIVVDPRVTKTAEEADLHLQLIPGSDIALALGMLHIATRERLLDYGFIAARTGGYRDVQRVVAGYWPERVEQITGVSVNKIVEATRILADAKTALVLTARGPEQQSKGVETVLSFINLALALGKVGKKGCGFGTLTGQGNGQGGREHGQKADQLPGYRKIDDPAARAHMAKVWGVEEKSIPGVGRSAYEMLSTLGETGGVRALLIMGSNVVVSSPNANLVRQKLQNLDFLCVVDLFLSETAALADVVLPSTQWAEEDGTMTNLEGRVLRRKQAQLPPVGAKSDLEILSRLAEKLGFKNCFNTYKPSEVFEEFRQATAGGIADYSGITYERIENEDGVFWPCPSEEHPGTPRLFLDKFHTPDGRARFHAVEYSHPDEVPCQQFPFYLTTGRVMAQYQSGTQTRRVPDLCDAAPRAFVEIHPSMASRYGLFDGELVKVISRRGEVLVETRFSTSIRPDTLFIPFHWGGASCANLLTNPALDPTSKMPEFKVCAARIEALNSSNTLEIVSQTAGENS